MDEVELYIQSIQDEDRKADCKQLFEIMHHLTGTKPRLWNKTMIGFGTYTYKDKSGREGEWFKVGFANRKQYLTIYLVSGFEHLEPLLSQLGTHSLGSSCLYIKSLDTIDKEVLTEMIKLSYEHQQHK